MLTSHRHERGSAMIAAIALLVIGAFVVVAMMVSSRASVDNARNQLDKTTSELLARDAGTAIAAAYNASAAGEFNGFIPRQAVLEAHREKVTEGTVLLNTDAAIIAGGYSVVDGARIPANAQYTLRQRLDDGRFGYWQILSAWTPEWGDTTAARVALYVRVWTTNEAGASAKSSVYRLEFRPSWFSDYQVLTDGPMLFGATANLAGKVHSNGYRASYYQIYDIQLGAVNPADPDAFTGPMINIKGSCAAVARITVSNGAISAPAGCTQPGPRDRINLLRSRDHAARLRTLCGNPAVTTLYVVCAGGTGGTTTVALNNNDVVVNGITYSALVQGNGPADRQGVVVLADGDVNVTGVLAATARASVVAATPPDNSVYGVGAAPSVWMKSSNNFGAANDQRSSFGIVAEGDVVADESAACPLVARGAFLSMTGMLGIRPQTRVPFVTGTTGVMCPSSATFAGSIVGHFAPALEQPANGAGYTNRSYTYLKALFDNPPPLAPTAEDWAMTKMAPANLDCFKTTSLASSKECH